MKHHHCLASAFVILLQAQVALGDKTTALGKTKALVMGALGDSITMATNSTGWGDRPFDSWATGDNRSGLVDSHYRKFERLLNEPIEKYNFSRSGATSRDLDKQLQSLLPHRPDYVSILMGANDACSWSDDYEADLLKYQIKMSESVAALIETNPQVKILLLPVPDLNRLREISHKQRGCQWLWDTLRICTPLLQSKRTPDERDAFSKRVHDINSSLQTLAERFPNHINYKFSLADYQFQPSHVSTRDCFHPSAEGQDLISSLTWDADWVADILNQRL